MKIYDHIFEITLTLFILTSYLYLYNTNDLVFFMNGVLGKLLAISIIIFYTLIDKIYGLLTTLIIILYYQLDSTQWLSEGFFALDSLCGSCSNGSSSDVSDKSTNNDRFLTPLQKTILEDELPLRKKTEFQQKNCTITGDLMYKGFLVKKDMTSIVYPDVKFNSEYEICDVCDKNCKFDVA